jgi:hypothetical protein
LLWLSFGIVVRVQGRTFHPKLIGDIQFKTQTEFDFDVDGKRISGVARTLNPLAFRQVRVAVLVENVEIGREPQTVERWYLSYLAWMIVAAALLLAVFALVILALVLWKRAH